MPKIKYQEKNFSAKSLAVIAQANEIIAIYAAQGFNLTLRQLYYQFVSRDLIANKQSEYKRLGAIVSDGRRAGLIDWDAITDRTRELKSVSHWETPASIISDCSTSFALDKWADQDYRLEVWIEKDALAGVFERVCHEEWDLPYFSCRGYTSDSEIWAAAMRLRSYQLRGQTPVILHFGDHDPSGIDMTRDITDRLTLFSGLKIEVQRVALNMDQIEQYQPPPNPAKDTDSRFSSYIEKFGEESWELDALEPTVLAELVSQVAEKFIDFGKWAAKKQQELESVETLKQTFARWDDVVKFLNNGHQP